jgi:hypothetical protein
MENKPKGKPQQVQGAKPEPTQQQPGKRDRVKEKRNQDRDAGSRALPLNEELRDLLRKKLKVNEEEEKSTLIQHIQPQVKAPEPNVLEVTIGTSGSSTCFPLIVWFIPAVEKLKDYVKKVCDYITEKRDVEGSAVRLTAKS